LLDNLVDNATLDSIGFYGNECALFIGRHYQFSVNIWLKILFLKWIDIILKYNTCVDMDTRTHNGLKG
jgi:hypothetical protein